MDRDKKFFDDEKSFYLKTLIKAWGCYCLVYFYMIVQFCWSNHDWWYLKGRVHIDDGFFEARYNQHLLNVVLFDGQILPVIVYLVSFLFLALFSLFSAAYLKIPRSEKKWLFFLLVVGLNPHIFVLFSYVYIMLAFIFWGCFGIVMLFLVRPPYKVLKLLGAVISGLLVLGSYPPIVGFVATLFTARQVILLLSHQFRFRSFAIECGVFIVCWGMVFLLYKFLMIPYVVGDSFNAGMYNIKTVSSAEIWQRLGIESFNALAQFWRMYPFLDGGYWKVLLLIVLFAVGLSVYRATSRGMVILFVFGVFLASRVAFVVAENADFAAFRLSYWGKTGVLMFALSVLLRDKSIMVRNFVVGVGGLALFLFIRTDFEIQKVWNLGFRAERLSHTRWVERITQDPRFKIDEKYGFLNFGTVFYKWRFYNGKTRMEDNELLSVLALPADLGEILFWEDGDNPILAKFGVWADRLWLVNNHKFENPNNVALSLNDDFLLRLRYWMYTGAGVYPSDKAIYIDNGYIFVVANETIFYRSKELVLDKIKMLFL